MNALRNTILVSVLLSAVAAVMAPETAITAVSFNTANMTFSKIGRFLASSPAAIVVIAEPARSAKQANDVSIVKSQNTDVDSGVFLRSFNTTNMTLEEFGEFLGHSPASVVVFEPVRSTKQPDNLLIVKAQNANTNTAVSLRLSFTGETINPHYLIPGDRGQKIELAIDHDNVTYLARAGDLTLSFDGDRLKGRIIKANMVPLQKQSAAFQLSGSFDALVDFSCWVSNTDSFTADASDGQTPAFRMDSTRSSDYCEARSFTDLMSRSLPENR